MHQSERPSLAGQRRRRGTPKLLVQLSNFSWQGAKKRRNDLEFLRAASNIFKLRDSIGKREKVTPQNSCFFERRALLLHILVCFVFVPAYGLETDP